MFGVSSVQGSHGIGPFEQVIDVPVNPPRPGLVPTQSRREASRSVSASHVCMNSLPERNAPELADLDRVG
jgi:hypothetical protein